MGNNRGGGRNNDRRDDDHALMVLQPPRLPMPEEVRAEHGLTLSRWRSLVDAVYPSAKSVSGVMLALDYCKSRNLDPFKRVVHVVPMYSSKLGREVETVWPGIGEMRTTAHRTGQHAGNDDCVFGRVMKQGFKESRRSEGRNGGQPYTTEASCPEFEFPEWAQFTVYKVVAGMRVPFVGPKVRFMEIFSGMKGLRVPNDRWRQAPWQMLEKCAEAAALRRAFPEELGDEWSAEEMEGKVIRSMPTVDAEYHYVDPEAAAEASGDDAPVVVENGDRDLRGWDPDNLEEFIGYLRDGIPRAPDLAALEHGLQVNREKIEMLPDAEAEEVRGLERAARERLAKPVDGGDRRDVDDTDRDSAPADDDEPAGGDDDDLPAVEPSAEEEPPYLRNFRLRVQECDDIPALDRLNAAELPTLKKQPTWIFSSCDAAFRARRAELEGAGA